MIGLTSPDSSRGHRFSFNSSIILDFFGDWPAPRRGTNNSNSLHHQQPSSHLFWPPSKPITTNRPPQLNRRNCPPYNSRPQDQARRPPTSPAQSETIFAKTVCLTNPESAPSSTHRLSLSLLPTVTKQGLWENFKLNGCCATPSPLHG